MAYEYDPVTGEMYWMADEDNEPPSGFDPAEGYTDLGLGGGNSYDPSWDLPTIDGTTDLSGWMGGNNEYTPSAGSDSGWDPWAFSGFSQPSAPMPPGSYAANAANGRAQEAKLGNERDANRNTAYGIAQNAQMNLGNLDLNRKKYLAEVPGLRAGQAVRGDILANAQDVQLSGLNPKINVPQTTGGLRPSMFSGATRDLGRELSRKALLDQMTPETFEGGKILPMPEEVDMPGPSLLERADATTAGISSLLNNGKTLWDWLQSATQAGRDARS